MVIEVGAKGIATLMVGHEHLASSFKDALLPPVFATPMMVRLMENAALNAIRSQFGPHESSVGTAITLHHLAATPEGMRVRAEAEVTAVDGRRITFAVTAYDEVEMIGRGTHERVVINLTRFAARLAEKAR
jgi:fluoroacetyl-CoA thioesterase